MVTYRPPKAQIWGHSRRDLTAVQLLQRGDHFLDSNAHIRRRSNSVWSFSWKTGSQDKISPAVDDFLRMSAVKPVRQETVDPGGGLFRQISGEVRSEDTGQVALWLDAIRGLAAGQWFGTTITSFAYYDWKDWTRSSHHEAKLPTSTLGLRLGTLRGVTTMFNLVDIDHYQHVKRALAEIDLVKLSDSHVLPKNAWKKMP